MKITNIHGSKKNKIVATGMVHENKEINALKIYRSMVLNMQVNERWSMERLLFAFS